MERRERDEKTLRDRFQENVRNLGSEPRDVHAVYAVRSSR